METTSKNQQILNYLRSFGFPLESCLRAVICLYWISKRAFARDIDVSHTSLNQALKKYPRNGRVKEAIERKLNIHIS